jgi:hypothetical protein
MFQDALWLACDAASLHLDDIYCFAGFFLQAFSQNCKGVIFG